MYRRRLPRTSGNPLGLLFLLVAGVLLTAGVLGFWGQVSEGRFGKFDRFNVVIAGPQVVFVSLSPAQKSATVIRFPPDFYLTEVIHGYGQYKISSVYAAGELDHRGGKTLAGTISEFLGVPVDGFIQSREDSSDLKKFFLQPAVFFSPASDLNLLDRLRFVVSLEQIRFDRLKTVDLGELATPLVLADGSSAVGLEKSEADNYLLGSFIEGRVQDEGLRVEVVNTTDVMGLGARVSRLLANIGLSVVNVENGVTPVTNCQIIATQNALKSLTVSKIAGIYSCSLTKKAAEGRAAITVLLGKDYVDWLTQ